MKKIIILILLTQLPALAYLSVNESAEILPENYFNLGFAPQVFLSNGNGYDISVYGDMHLMENTDVRLTLGGGDIDFWTQASIKWVPFPDVDNQPAMGLRGAVAYVRDNDNSYSQIQIAPIVSKKSTTSKHDMIPYFSLPITFVFEKNHNYTSSQAALGAIWFPWPSAQIGAEFDLSLKDSTSSASVFLNFPFDASVGYKKY
jgi:hypothetical protein